MADFSISNAFKNSFGINVESKMPDNLKDLKADVGYPNETTSSNQRADGTGVFMWDRFLFIYNDGVNQVEYTLPDATVVEPSQAKHIVTTLLTKVEGTVKEHINIGDWHLEFKGLIINYESMTFPQNQIVEMRKFFRVNDTLKVVSKILNDYGIYEVVLTNIRFPEMAGYPNAQPFIISALSDRPIKLILD